MDKPAEKPTIMVRPMCEKHRGLLVQQCRYSRTDPWQALEVVTGITLFQAATALPRTWERIKDPTEIPSLGCLACYMPDVFGEIVEAGKTRDLKNIKAIGDAYIAKYKKDRPVATVTATPMEESQHEQKND